MTTDTFNFIVRTTTSDQNEVRTIMGDLEAAALLPDLVMVSTADHIATRRQIDEATHQRLLEQSLVDYAELWRTLPAS